MASTTYAAWSAIAPVSIVNEPSVADYPVRVDLAWLDDEFGTMNADFSDIRFVDASDNALSYWIESYTASTSAVVWVKVASGATAISVVYGNAAATSESSGAGVFSLFDDFSAASLDSSKWDTVGSPTVSGGIVTCTASCIKSKATFGLGYAMHTRAAATGDANLCILSIDSFANYSTIDRGNAQAQFRTGNAKNLYQENATGVPRDTAYHQFAVARISANAVRHYIDGALVFTQTNTTYIPTDAAKAMVRTWTSGHTVTADWVLVRKCAATEPVCTVGTARDNSAVSVPVAAFSADVLSGPAPLTVAFTDESLDTPTSWDWDFGDGSAHSTAQNPTHAYALPGTYPVTLTVTNGAGEDTETKTGYITVHLPAAMTYATYAEWPYAFEYPIANPPAVDGYPVPLTVAWKPGMRQDFRDLRFRAPDLRPCSYGIASKTDGATALVWIQLYSYQPRLSMLFGNGAAVSESDLDATLLLSDTFDGAAIDAAKWTALGDVAIAGGAVTMDGAGALRSVETFADGTAVRIRASAANIYYDATLGYGTGTNPTATWAIDITMESGVGILTVTESTQSTNFGPISTTSQVWEVCRAPSAGAVRYYKDGVLAGTHTNGTSAAAAIAIENVDRGNTLVVESVLVRKYVYPEPTLGTPRQGLNPWYPLVSRYIDRGQPAAWEAQRLVSYSVSRGIADALSTMSGTFDTVDTYGIRNFPGVALTVPDHNGVDRLIWYGFVPEFGFAHEDAADETGFAGYDYGYFLVKRPLPLDMTVMPAASEPGAWLKAYFDDPAEWGGAVAGFDTNHIHAVPGWGSTVTARDIVGSESMNVLQMGEKIADDLDWIFYPKWCDVGTTPSLTHQNPAYRIIRVQAADFDPGGEGVAYHDNSTGHPYHATDYWQPRLGEGVDLGQKPDGTGWFIEHAGDAGLPETPEWVTWTVDIPVAGDWSFSCRAGARYRIPGGSAPSVALYVDDAKVADIPVAELQTAFDPSDLPWSTPISVALTAGAHGVKIVFDNVNDTAVFECFDLVPPAPAEPVPPILRPAIYFINADDIDDPALGLDLPPMVTVTDPDPLLVGRLEYREAFGEVANAVAVRYRATAGGAIAEVKAFGVPSVGGWIYHTETLSGTRSAAAAQAVADDLLAFYSTTWGAVTATFARRTDLEHMQKIRFVGFAGVPEVEMRIVAIRVAVEDVDVEVRITAMPIAKFTLLRKLARSLNPDLVSEIAAVAAAERPREIVGWGTLTADLGGGQGTILLDSGASMTCAVDPRGVVGDYGPVLYEQTWIVTRPAST